MNYFDNAFHRRREIEWRLLTGRKLTISELMLEFSVSRNAIRRDFEIIGEGLLLIVKQGYGVGYFLMDGPGRYQNALSQEQLKCLLEIKIITACGVGTTTKVVLPSENCRE